MFTNHYSEIRSTIIELTRMENTVVNPYQGPLSHAKLNEGIDQSGGYKGYPSQKENHTSPVLIGTGGEQEINYGMKIYPYRRDALFLPKRICVPVTMTNYNCWYKVADLPMPSSAAEPGTMTYENWTEDTEGSAEEATEGFSVGASVSTGFMGTGAELTVESSISYTKSYNQSHSEGVASGVEISVAPGQRGQLWMGQRYIKLTCDFWTVRQGISDNLENAKKFFDDCLMPGYAHQGIGDPKEVTGRMIFGNALSKRPGMSSDDVVIALAKLAYDMVPVTLEQELILNATPVHEVYPTFSDFVD